MIPSTPKQESVREHYPYRREQAITNKADNIANEDYV